jgi:tetratricopeptide (TPR) repeat protein
VDLARSGADAFYLERPPLESLENASKRVKSDLRKRLASARSRLRGPAADGVQKMLDRIGPDPTATADNGDAEPTSMEGSEASAGTTTRAAPAAFAGDDADADDAAPTDADLAASAVVLPRFVRHNDEVTQFLRAAEFERAIAMVDKLLGAEQAKHVNMRWFQRGIARRALADKEPDALRAEALYKRAGLDFMRVVVYFPSGRYRAACQVEIGFVHQRIGRADKARELYEEAAQGSSAIKAKTEPEYFERLEELRTVASRE